MAGGLALFLSACFADDADPVELHNANVEGVAGVVLELDDSRERLLYLECDEPAGCEISFRAALISPDPCDLFGPGELCSPGVESPEDKPIAHVELESDGHEAADPIIAARSDTSTTIDRDTYATRGPGTTWLAVRRAPGVDRPLTIRFEAAWGGHQDGGHRPPGEGDADPEPVDNLLSNPGFEEGEGAEGCPVAWTCVTYRPSEAGEFFLDADAYEGDFAAAWRGDEPDAATVIRQVLPSSPGARYELGAQVRTQGLSEPPLVQLLFENERGDVLDSERFHGEAEAADWSRITAQSPAAPAGTARVRFNLSTDGTAGTVWWDDAELIEIDPGGGDEPIAGTDLCELGLSDGASLNPYLEQHHRSGETLLVCRGTYDLSSINLSGDDWALIAPEGATLNVSGATTLATDGSRYLVSGFVFDQTAPGARLSLTPAGDDWIVERVAWRGQSPGGAYLMAPSVDSADATGLIDRAYLGDGQVEGTKAGGVWVNANRGHHGELTFRRAYLAHFVDNGLYATGPPTQGQPGKTHVEDSYFWSNTISNARTGSLSGPCFVRGSVFVVDDTTQACGEGCSSPGARTTRAVWAWYGEVIVEDSDFAITHGQRLATAHGGTTTERGNRVGASADTTPPAGVPTSPEAIFDTRPRPWPPSGESFTLDYGDYDSPSQIYNVNDNRSGIAPSFVSSPTFASSRALRKEFSSNAKTANVEYRFGEHGYDEPRELYTRFYLFPEDIELPENATVRVFWLPLTNGPGSSGGGATDGTNGWSNAIGFSHRNGSPAPDGYHFFSYSYHMDRGGSGDFEMTSAPVWMDEWNLVEGYVRANTFDGGSANPDGVMRYWVNGELAYERTDLRVTASEDNLIEGTGPLGYVVGADLSGSALIYDGHTVSLDGVPSDAAAVRAAHRDYLAARR